MSLAAATDSWAPGTRVFLRSNRAEKVCQLRGNMVSSGIEPIDVGSTEWFPADEWDPDTLIGRGGQDIYLLLIVPARRWNGCFSRLVTGIIRHRLTPVVLGPVLDMPRILRRWGWERGTVQFAGAPTEAARPSLLWQAERMARS